MFRRLVLAAAVASVGGLALAGPASAHIDPDPTEAQAGSSLTVGFTIEHGCEGSPTVQIDMRLPDGVTAAAPEPFEGWTASISPDADTGLEVVSFADGVLPADAEGTFQITMTMPPTPDTTIYFPIVQRCEVGEIRWIGIPTAPGDELDEPAPAIGLTGPVATPPTVTPSSEPAAPVATDVTATVGPGTTAPDNTVANSTTAAVTATTEAVLVSERVETGADTGAGTAVFIGVIAAVVALGAFVALRARQSRAAGGGHSTPDASS